MPFILLWSPPSTADTSFAVFLCLQCAGVHRGFGVHIRCVSSFGMHHVQPPDAFSVQFREIGVNGYVARRANQEDAGQSSKLLMHITRTNTGWPI